MKVQNRLLRSTTAVPGKPASAWPRLMAIGGFCLLFQSAQASQLFSDGFNYTSGGNLYNASTSYQATTSANSSYITIGTGNLTYPGLSDFSPSGNDVSVAGNQNVAGVQTAASFAAQSGAGTVVYASFLLDVTSLVAGQTQNYGMAGLLPTNAGYSSTADPCGLCIKTTGGASPTYVLEIRSSSSTTGSDATYGSQAFSLTAGSVNLVVLKYDFSAKTASLYVNPTSLGGSDPGTPSVSLTESSVSPANLSQLYLRMGGNALTSPNLSAPFLVDDVRVGTTWADVTPAPVPEPAAAALMGLGLLGLALSRRLRRGAC